MNGVLSISIFQLIVILVPAMALAAALGAWAAARCRTVAWGTWEQAQYRASLAMLNAFLAERRLEQGRAQPPVLPRPAPRRPGLRLVSAPGKNTSSEPRSISKET